MTTAADDLAVVAVGAGLGLVAGTTVFSGPLPPQSPQFDAPAAVGHAVYGASRASERAFGSAALKWEWPRVQVLVRGQRDGLAAAEALAGALYKAYGAVECATVNGAFYHAVTCLQPPAFMRNDADGRPEVVFNVECYREVPA